MNFPTGRFFGWAAAALLVMAGCSSKPADGIPSTAGIVQAVAKQPGGVTGTFLLSAESFRLGEGVENGAVYLFSTRDYRDPACLTIFISAPAAQQFRARGEELPFALSGRRLSVSGTARLAKAHRSNSAFIADVVYDRTQIDVSSVDQIRILPAP